MKSRLECEEFQDRLDRLRAGEAPPEMEGWLRGHAARCEECRAVWRLQEALALPPPGELERSVPSEMVDAMWFRLRTELAARRVVRPSGERARTYAGGSTVSRWLVPSMAAAIALLIFGVGFLVSDRIRLREREEELSARLAQTELRAAIVGSEGPRLRASYSKGESGAVGRALPRSLTLGALEAWLGGLPASTTVLDRADLELAIRSRRLGVAPAWSVVPEEVEPGDGLQAGELLRALRSLPLDPSTEIPLSQIRREVPAASIRGLVESRLAPPARGSALPAPETAKNPR